MDAEKIYRLLREGGLSRAGALGMLGNMMAESGLKENIAQRGMTKLSDAQYTAAADNGLIQFALDGVGYGLYQLSYKTRKAGYLAYCKAQDCSVGDGVAQVEYCLKELTTDFPALYSLLCSSTNIDQCSDLICTQFERPAVNNLTERRAFAHKFEKQLSDKPMNNEDDAVQATFPPEPAGAAGGWDFIVALLQLCMVHDGYLRPEDVTGYKNQKFRETIPIYAADVAAC